MKKLRILILLFFSLAVFFFFNTQKFIDKTEASYGLYLYDSTWTKSTYSNSPGATLTLPSYKVQGSFLVVFAHKETSASGDCGVNSITFNGKTLNHIESVSDSDGARKSCLVMYGIDGPGRVTSNIVVNWSSSGTERSLAAMQFGGANMPESDKSLAGSPTVSVSLTPVHENSIILGAAVSGASVLPTTGNLEYIASAQMNSSSLRAGKKKIDVGQVQRTVTWSGLQNRGAQILASFRSPIWSDRLFGNAWSSNFGWIDFNFYDEPLTSPPGWSHKRTITVSSSNISGSQYLFSMLLNLSGTYLQDAEDKCRDITFGEFGEVFSQQIIKGDCLNGSMLAWIATTSSTYAGKDFHMYYGNKAADIDLSNNKIWDDNFIGVWQLNGNGEDDKGGNSVDYSSSGITYVAGKVGDAARFDGDEFMGTKDKNLDDIDGPLTLEAWVKVSGNGIIAQRSNSAGEIYYKLWASGGNKVNWTVRKSGVDTTVSADIVYNSPTWTYVAGVYDPISDLARIYVNGSHIADASLIDAAFADDPNDNGIIFGAGWNGSAFSDFFTGDIDEVRLSKTARSRTSNWITASYRSINSPITTTYGQVSDLKYNYQIHYGMDFNHYTGDISGYAWNPFVGWITFNKSEFTGTPPDNYAFQTAHCPDLKCGLDRQCAACVNFDEKKVYGWGQVMGMGNDGWIGFHHNQPNSTYIGENAGKYYIRGFAWNGDTTGDIGLGWICFDSADCQSSSDEFHSRLKYWNGKPDAENLNTPIPQINFTSGLLETYLEWEFDDFEDGVDQAAYELQVFEDGILIIDLSGPNKVSSQNTVYQLSEPDLKYNKNYTWQVRVMDSVSQWSDWEIGTPFTTPKHRPPIAEIAKWFPVEPSEGEEVQFSASTTVFLTDPSNFPVTGNTCWVDADPDLNDPNLLPDGQCYFKWTIESGDAFFDTSHYALQPIIIFNDKDNPPTVKLEVFDNSGSCSAVKNFASQDIKVKLPVWIEAR